MEKELQVRATFEDTKNNQTVLFSLLRKKIRRNGPLSKEEKESFPDLLANSVLSQGWRHCYYTTKDNIRINLGSATFFALTLLDIDTAEVVITDPRTQRKYKIEISGLWNILYNKCKELAQPAREEAIHMSKEQGKREPQTAYDFSAQKEYH